MKQNRGMVERDGFPLAYRVEGQGIPVLVIGSQLYYPRLFSRELRERLQLIWVDHRGFVKGPEGLTEDDCSLDRVIEDIEALRKALGLEQLVILGHSGHAFMAWEYTRRYPQYVNKVVLLNTAPTNSKERQELSFMTFLETAEPDRKARFELDMAQLPAEIEQEPERRFAHLLIRMGAQSFYNYCYDSAYLWDGVCTNMPIIDHLWGEEFARLNLLDTLPHLHKPVFLGLGRYDYLVAPLSLWDAVSNEGGVDGAGAYSHVTKVIFEQSGHNPMLEEPELFDSILVEWIRRPSA